MGRLPLIGIEVDLEANAKGRRYAKCYESYFDAVSDAGGAPVLISPTSGAVTERVLAALDGLVVPGGDDFSAEDWGEVQRPCERFAASDARRLEHGRRLVQSAIQAGLPYLGICYGAQILNLVRGGTLVQDIPDEIADPLDHGEPHTIEITPNTLLARLTGTLSTGTNSRHHQSVLKVGQGLRVSATSSDGVVEAIEGTPEDRFLLGIQWHGEELADAPAGAPLFQGLIAAALEQALQAQKA